MKKKLHLLLILLLCALLFCGCGKKKHSASGNVTVPLPVTPPPAEAASVSPEPEEEVEYNTISSADRSERKLVREQLLNAAQACADIYAEADKGEAINVVLPNSSYYAMVERIGSLGYAAADALGNWDMEGSGALLEFCEELYLGQDCAATYYTVYSDGQISAYHLACELGKWHLITMTATWDKKGNPSVVSEGQYQISDVHYTDKGYLIYNRNYDSFDDNQRSNSNSYVFIRVKPCDSTKRELCRKYIEPIGYFENNLFTTTWNQANPSPIDFNSLYAYLFGMYHGTDMLSSYNVRDYFSAVEGTNLYVIPTDRFEEVVQYYFDINSASLKNISDYNSRAGGYFFLGYQNGYYNITPRTPQPEVVDYRYNSDGSVTMRVDAVNKWYGTDRAFTHEVTVYEYESGRIKYISNTLYESEDNILPENKLCHLLDIERKKTDY